MLHWRASALRAVLLVWVVTSLCIVVTFIHTDTITDDGTLRHIRNSPRQERALTTATPAKLETTVPPQYPSLNETLQQHFHGARVAYLVYVDNVTALFAANLDLYTSQHVADATLLFVTDDFEVFSSLRKVNPTMNMYYHKYSHTDEAKIQKEFSAHDRGVYTKLAVTLGAIYSGFRVVFLEADVVLLKSPVGEFKNCPECDLHLLHADGNHALDYFMAAPTQIGADVISTFLDDVQSKLDSEVRNKSKSQKDGGRDTSLLHMFTGLVKTWVNKQMLRIKTLNSKLYLTGDHYLGKLHRSAGVGKSFLQQSVMIKNDGFDLAKERVLDLKEQLLWRVDTNKYYSDTNRKYLIYHNPAEFGDDTRLHEMDALRNALAIGVILNRTVIIPRCHCTQCITRTCPRAGRLCSFSVHVPLDHFDKTFGDTYREYSFLDNDLVPATVKHNLSPLLLIDSVTIKQMKAAGRYIFQAEEIFSPVNKKSGATTSEIRNWFGGPRFSSYAVLRFHSLYDAFADDYVDPTLREINMIKTS